MSYTCIQPLQLDMHRWSDEKWRLGNGRTNMTKVAGACESCKDRLASLRYRKILRSQRRRSACYMVKNFCLCRRLCRFFGCFFIYDLTENRVDKAKAALMTPYALYSLAWLSVTLYLHGEEIVRRVITIDPEDNFSHAVSTVLKMALMAKVIINVASMTFRSGQLLEFFRMCVRYEISSEFRPPNTHYSKRNQWVTIFYRFLITTAAVAMSTIMVFGYIQYISGINASWRTIVTSAATLVCTTGYFFYDSLMYLVMRSTTEVLVSYIQAQKKVFEDCGFAFAGGKLLITPRCEQSTYFKVASVRKNISKITGIKCFINRIWTPALSLSSGLLVWMGCMTFYTAVKRGIMHLHVWTAILYFGYVSLSFLELACISQSLSDEAQKLRESVRAAMTAKAPDLYFRELQYLHDTIDPQGMCIGGAGFFRLGKPLVIAMTGALISYTVILVQTSDEIMQRNVANTTFVQS